MTSGPNVSIPLAQYDALVTAARVLNGKDTFDGRVANHSKGCKCKGCDALSALRAVGVEFALEAAEKAREEPMSDLTERPTKCELLFGGCPVQTWQSARIRELEAELQFLKPPRVHVEAVIRRAEKAEAERDALTQEVERLRAVLKEMLVKSEYQQGWSAGYDMGIKEEAKTIERCAQKAEACDGLFGDEIAAELRALKPSEEK